MSKSKTLVHCRCPKGTWYLKRPYVRFLGEDKHPLVKWVIISSCSEFGVWIFAALIFFVGRGGYMLASVLNIANICRYSCASPISLSLLIGMGVVTAFGWPSGTSWKYLTILHGGGVQISSPECTHRWECRCAPGNPSAQRVVHSLDCKFSRSTRGALTNIRCLAPHPRDSYYIGVGWSGYSNIQQGENCCFGNA